MNNKCSKKLLWPGIFSAKATKGVKATLPATSLAHLILRQTVFWIVYESAYINELFFLTGCPA